MDQRAFFKIIAFCTLSLDATVGSGQYDTLFVGDAEAISVGPFETPFPTGGAVSSRTQYLFSVQDLYDAGVTSLQPIEGLLLDVLDSDPAGTTVDIAIKLKNTTTTCMSELEYSGLQFVEDTTMHLDAGTLEFLFSSPFQWNGGSNVVVEFCVQRSGPPGIDPRVTLDTSFVCDPTFYVQGDTAVPCGSLSSSLGATAFGPLGSRPVMGFLVDLPSAVHAGEAPATRVVLYPNPARDHVRLRLLDAPTSVNVRLFSAMGTLASQPTSRSPDANGFVDIPIEGLAPGCYLLSVDDVMLRPLWQQRFVVE